MKKDLPMKSLLTTLAMAGAALMIAATPVQAQKVTKISDNKIRAYYTDLSGLFKKPYAHFLTAYGDRIHPDLSLTSQTRIIMAGQDPVENDAIVLTKSDLIQNAQQAYDAARDAVLSTRVNDIHIAQNGRSAKVKTTSTIRKMKIPTSDGLFLNADSVENCDDDIVLNDHGALQIIQSSCTSQLTIKN